MPPLDSLSKDEIGRFSRQIILPDVGVKGQIKIRNSSVLIVGVGGLGCPAATYLVGAGIGKPSFIIYLGLLSLSGQENLNIFNLLSLLICTQYVESSYWNAFDLAVARSFLTFHILVFGFEMICSVSSKKKKIT